MKIYFAGTRNEKVPDFKLDENGFCSNLLFSFFEISEKKSSKLKYTLQKKQEFAKDEGDE